MSSIKNEWSDKEKEQLIEFFPKMGVKYCSELIGRTKRGCQEMAKKLKIKRVFKFHNEIELRKTIEDSKTYTECVIKVGLSPRCSGNFQTLKKYIKKYNIDISHFDGGKFQVGNIPKNKEELENLLKRDSYISRTSLKSRLYKEGFKKKECEICGIGEDWFGGSKIVHIIDHINGEPYDNRIENLRIVCPNCNSTLDTHGVGNRVKKIYDSEKDEYKSEKTHKKCFCNKVILKNSKMCSSCNGKSNRKVDRPIYEDLLRLVNEIGNTKAGEKYGVTEACIRKWIKNKW